MKRIFIIGAFTLAALTAYAQQNAPAKVMNECVVVSFSDHTQQKDPLYIINECAVSAEEVRELTNQGHIDVITVVREADQIKLYEQFGDTSNGVVLITLKDDLVWIAPEEPGEFMGGNIVTFEQWVKENIRYPEEMKNLKVDKVKVVVKFIIGKHGYIQPNSIIFLDGGNGNKAFTDEVRRVLLSSPRWVPAKQKGEAVAVSYVFPVIFSTK